MDGIAAARCFCSAEHSAGRGSRTPAHGRYLSVVPHYGLIPAGGRTLTGLWNDFICPSRIILSPAFRNALMRTSYREFQRVGALAPHRPRRCGCPVYGSRREDATGLHGEGFAAARMRRNCTGAACQLVYLPTCQLVYSSTCLLVCLFTRQLPIMHNHIEVVGGE